MYAAINKFCFVFTKDRIALHAQNWGRQKELLVKWTESDVLHAIILTFLLKAQFELNILEIYIEC